MNFAFLARPTILAENLACFWAPVNGSRERCKHRSVTDEPIYTNEWDHQRWLNGGHFAHN